VGNENTSRRRFLKLGVAAAALCRSGNSLASALAPRPLGQAAPQSESSPPDYTLHIESSAIEIAPKRIVSAITYNGQFPGPLLRFQEGRQVTVEVHNDTDAAEQLHWHGQMVSPDVDGAAED
jgi:FtsP/CotA-like multicopper oxidase with cupredoxin domain